MSRYSGTYNKGASKDTTVEKRGEAEARNVEYRARLALVEGGEHVEDICSQGLVLCPECFACADGEVA